MSPLFKKVLFRGTYLVVSVVAIIFLLELLLAGLEKVTGNRDFSTYANIVSDQDPDVVEIAVFGGSAAAGHQSETSFMELLRWELEQKYPSQKFVFKNFARAGYPFHGVEAEKLKQVIDGYDIFLVYSGNNEAWNYLDEVGYFRSSEHKNRKFLPQTDSGVANLLKPDPNISNPWSTALPLGLLLSTNCGGH